MIRLSVCIATHNGERFLRPQIESILGQIGSEDEVIIQDDSSNDKTLAMLAEFVDSRLKVEVNSRNLGVVKTIERALERSNGQFVFLADQDDVWLPGRVDRALELHKQYDLVVVNCRVVDGDLNPMSDDFFAYQRSGAGIVKNLYRNTFLGCCMSFHRTILKDALPFPHPIPMHDMWIGLVASLSGRVLFCDEKFVLYRRHSDALSSAATGAPARPFMKMLRDRWQLITGLIKRYSGKVFGRRIAKAAR